DLLAKASDELETLLLEAGGGLGPVRLDGFQDRFGEVEELSRVGDGLRLAAQRDEDADVSGDRREHLALGRRAAGLLARGRDALLAQEPLRRLDVAPGLLERALGGHHPRARAVAKILHLACRDLHLAHSDPS